MTKKSESKLTTNIDRRKVLKYGGGAAAIAAAASFPAPAVHAQRKAVKIGFVSPQTGPLDRSLRRPRAARPLRRPFRVRPPPWPRPPRAGAPQPAARERNPRRLTLSQRA